MDKSQPWFDPTIGNIQVIFPPSGVGVRKGTCHIEKVNGVQACSEQIEALAVQTWMEVQTISEKTENQPKIL